MSLLLRRHAAADSSVHDPGPLTYLALSGSPSRIPGPFTGKDSDVLAVSATDTASLLVFEAAEVVATDITAQQFFSGGFFFWYEVERQRARKRRQEIEEAEEEARRIQDEIDREIAQRLQKLEREEAERQEFRRLADLASRYVAQQAQDEFSDRVLKAVIRANATQSAAALAQLRFEIERQLEDEEMALLLILNQ